MATFTGQPGVAADYLQPGLAPTAGGATTTVGVLVSSFTVNAVLVPSITYGTTPIGG